MAIVWNQERMTTGIPEIDQEHQELIVRFNQFHEAMTRGQGRDAASRLLGFIIDYTETHFAHEEKCMRDLRCTAAAANLAAHNALRREVAALKGRLKSGAISIVDLVKIERTLGDWLQNHICAIDVRLRECARR